MFHRWIAAASLKRSRALSARLCPRSMSDGSGDRPDTGPPKVISIDKSGLVQTEYHNHGHQPHKENETAMARHIKSLIRFGGGPITVAKYMSEVLTNPRGGYYTSRPVFGPQGDFLTSPEISQLFGEMIGIWCMCTWHDMGRPGNLQLVELGPGRGTLMADLLRGTAPFREFTSALTVHLVEVSNLLKSQQAVKLGCPGLSGPDTQEMTSAISSISQRQVTWHRCLDDVPQGLPTLFIAHEFFDALPVHQFQLTRDHGWCERLVDTAEGAAPLHFRLVLSTGSTVAGGAVLRPRMMALPPDKRFNLKAIEVCPESIHVAGELAKRIVRDDGAALIIDYGQDGPYTDSLVGIRNHKAVDIFEQPGMADLSARVDFDALRHGVELAKVAAECHGPITQSQFLQGLGIVARLESLLENVKSEEEGEILISGWKRLTGAPSSSEAEAGAIDGYMDGMGLSYKAFCITRGGRLPPIPFRQT